MSCDVVEVTERLENELCYDYNNQLCSFSNISVTAHSPTLPSLYLRHSSFSNPSVASPASQLILQPFFRFTYVTVHSPTLLSLYLHHSSFSNPSFVSPTSQLILQPSVTLAMPQIILQPFRCFTYVTVHPPTLLSLLLRHKLCSFSNVSFTSPTSLLILKPFCRFIYVTVHSPTLLSFYLRQSSFTNPFCCFTYITAHSPTLLLLLLYHRLFIYITWQAIHESTSCGATLSIIVYKYLSRAHSPTFLSFHLHHSSFFNPSLALPMSQLIHQPFCCFTYITAHSPTLLLLLLCHRLFTYVTWRTAQQ